MILLKKKLLLFCFFVLNIREFISFYPLFYLVLFYAAEQTSSWKSTTQIASSIYTANQEWRMEPEVQKLKFVNHVQRERLYLKETKKKIV